MKLVVCGVVVLLLTSLVGCSGDDDDSSGARSSSSTTHGSRSSSSSSASTSSTTGSGSTGGSQVVAGGFDGDTASFELRGDADTVHITTADLGRNKYRVSVPSAAGASPRSAVHNNDVVVTLEPRSGGSAAAVEVTLDESVSWSIRRDGSDRLLTVDAASGHVPDLEFAGTAQSLDISLPRPSGTVPLKITGGATTVALHAPSSVPVQVAFPAGAASISVDGASRTGVAAGTTVTPPGWDTAADRYDVAVPGVSSFTLDRG
jgi:hypothetical protein